MNINKFFDIITPRFVEDKVAVIKSPDGNLFIPGGPYKIICSFQDLKPGEFYDKVFVVKCFNFFGLGLFPGVVKDLSR